MRAIALFKNGTVSAILTVLVVIGVVSAEVGGGTSGRDVACGALLIFVAIEAKNLVRGGRIMLGVCLAASLATWIFLPDGPALLHRALAEAAFIIALFGSLSLLRDAAESSELVRASGGWMVCQPPSRRYLVLSIGSHFISLVLNFGVLPLLGTMVLKGNTLEAAGNDPRIAAIRQQRMLTAVLRGYCMMTIWSPLSVCFVVTQMVFPGLIWWRLLPLQLGLAFLLMTLGWLMDKRAFANTQRTASASGGGNYRAVIGLTGLVGGVVLASILWGEYLGVRPVVGAMMVVPAATLVWLFVQYQDAGPLGALPKAVRRLGHRLTISMPAYRNEFVILGGALFSGRLASAFLSPELVGQAIGWLPVPPVCVAVLLAWLMMVLARYGISQIVTLTLLGSAVSQLTQLGIPTLVLASGLMGAWALSTTTTPIGAAALTIARLAGVSNQTVAREWNGRFVLAGAVLLGLWMLTCWALSLVI